MKTGKHGWKWDKISKGQGGGSRGLKSTILRGTEENPQQKLHTIERQQHTTFPTLWLIDGIGLGADSVKKVRTKPSYMKTGINFYIFFFDFLNMLGTYEISHFFGITLYIDKCV